MSRHSPITTAVVTLLGAALGGLLIWRSLRAQKKKKTLPQGRKEAGPLEEPVTPEPAPVVVEHQPSRLPASLPCPEQLLGGTPVMVNSQEDWDKLWPSLQSDLALFPVLGLDCEWVKFNGVRRPFACPQEKKTNRCCEGF